MVTFTRYIPCKGTWFMEMEVRLRTLVAMACPALTAAMAMIAGLRFYLLATGITLLVFTVLHGLSILKERIQARPKKRKRDPVPDDRA